MTHGVLLIHAFPMDARMWAPQLELGPAVAPHLPGFGGSEPAGDVMTMSAAAARCLAALDEAGVATAIVCGLSMGGYVAFELWRSAPHRVAGLVLANTKSGADTPEAAEARRALAARLRSEGIGFLVDQPPPLLSDAAPEGLRAHVRDVISDQFPDAVAAAALGMAERPDSTKDLPTIDVPTLVITSDADTLIPAEVSAPMAEQIPGARLAVIEGAGHLSNLERADSFSAELAAHLRLCGVTV
jgi:pimeloyl-ACP methyl ester carboxylesterase